MRLLAERPDLGEDLRAVAVAGLGDGDPFVRRAAAEALGRHPRADLLRPLLDARHGTPPEDTHLLHVVRMALRNQLRDGANWPSADDASFSAPDLRALADVATGVPSRDAARFLLRHLAAYPEPHANVLRYEHHIARFGDADTDDALMSLARRTGPGGLIEQGDQLREVFQGWQERGRPPTDSGRDWAAEVIGGLLESPEAKELGLGLELAGLIELPEVYDRLVAIAGDRSRGEGIRIGALRAIQATDPADATERLARILVDASDAAGVRRQAASLLGQSGRPEARDRLLEALTAAPGGLQAAIANALAANREGAEALLARIAEGKASARLLRDRGVESRLRSSGIPEVDRKLDELTAGLAEGDESIAALLELHRLGYRDAATDAGRGAQVFEKNCATCHQLGGKGAKIGPQLDGVGIRGAERLLEDILDPSRNVDQAFRVTTLALDDGRVVTGLLLREEGEVLVLADSQGKEVRVDRAAVEERALVPLSLMPANLHEQVPEAEFYDLLRYLLESREKAAGG
jgi:putative heme-binding domain-containing protein